MMYVNILVAELAETNFLLPLLSLPRLGPRASSLPASLVCGLTPGWLPVIEIHGTKFPSHRDIHTLSSLAAILR